jgi:hypothetical protein
MQGRLFASHLKDDFSGGEHERVIRVAVSDIQFSLIDQLPKVSLAVVAARNDNKEVFARDAHLEHSHLTGNWT